MNKDEMIKKLNQLIQLDIDAAHAYEQAIGNISDAVIRDNIQGQQRDHERHITELSQEVRELGGTPEAYSKDFKGYLIEGFTSLRSITGTQGALKAMQGNEQLTNKYYESATEWDLTPAAKAIVEKNLSDERRHLNYINGVLK